MSVQQLKCVLAQINLHVGAFEANTDLILAYCQQALSEGAQLIVFPELALSGYPPEDLLLRPSLGKRVKASLERIYAFSQECELGIVLGYPELADAGRLYNSAIVIHQGQQIANYRKRCLPNYQVFDEKRYFQTGHEPCVFSFDGLRLGLSICEDLWFDFPARSLKEAGAEVIININASPFHLGKMQERKRVLQTRAWETGLPIIYSHGVGGQDELVFDGGSMLVDASGECVFEAERFVEARPVLELVKTDAAVQVSPTQASATELGELEELHQALVLGLRDYVNKNGFKGVVLGLSGGIDSALTLALAVEALGHKRVEAIMMPFRYTSQMSRDDAAKQAATLAVKYGSIAIEDIYTSFMQSLEHEFAGLPVDTTEENLQARCRGVILMAVSNKKGYLVLTTGNKSELAVGYSTLYGDMAGGFDVLKDVPKTLVFRLAEHINKRAGKEIIPQRVIERPPSAELAPDQKDEDSLPPYPVLDQILALYVERDASAEDIIAQGFERDEVYKVVRLVDRNEYKRRQAPIGTRVTPRAFGRDRRYPITNGWRAGD